MGVPSGSKSCRLYRVKVLLLVNNYFAIVTEDLGFTLRSCTFVSALSWECSKYYSICIQFCEFSHAKKIYESISDRSPPKLDLFLDNVKAESGYVGTAA